MSILMEATDTSKYDNATLIKSWAIVVADMFNDGSRPLEPGDPRRAELTAQVQKTRPWFNADEVGDEDGTYKWEPHTLGMFYAEDIVQAKMPDFPVVGSWVERMDISADVEHGCFDVTFESKEYAPRGVAGDDGRISITFIRTIRVVTDPQHPQFDHDVYIAEIGELYEVTPVTVYPSGLDCTFTPADAYLIATALEECTRDAMAAAGTNQPKPEAELSEDDLETLDLVVHLPGDMRKLLRYVTADDLDAKGNHIVANLIRPYENYEAALRAGAIKGVN